VDIFLEVIEQIKFDFEDIGSNADENFQWQCFMLGRRTDYLLCGLVVRVYSDISRGPGFDFRCCDISCEAVVGIHMFCTFLVLGLISFRYREIYLVCTYGDVTSWNCFHSLTFK
jgi:hypothetical protein